MTRLLCASLLLTGLATLAVAQDPPATDPPARPVVPPGLGPADDAAPAPEPAPADDPLREPIERQPIPEPVAPPPGNADAFPPPAAPGAGERPVPPSPESRDPAYRPPTLEGADAVVPIDEIVRNPVRVYEARLLVLMGHAPAAAKAVEILGQRFPTDARVAYLRYFLLARTGQQEAALESLRQAVSLETVYPIGDYNRFMEPIQGPDRFYAERVRRAAAEVAALDRLAEPEEAELLPPAGPIPLPAAPMPGAGRPAAPMPGVRLPGRPMPLVPGRPAQPAAPEADATAPDAEEAEEAPPAAEKVPAPPQDASPDVEPAPGDAPQPDAAPEVEPGDARPDI